MFGASEQIQIDSNCHNMSIRRFVWCCTIRWWRQIAKFWSASWSDNFPKSDLSFLWETWRFWKMVFSHCCTFGRPPTPPARSPTSQQSGDPQCMWWMQAMCFNFLNQTFVPTLILFFSPRPLVPEHTQVMSRRVDLTQQFLGLGTHTPHGLGRKVDCKFILQNHSQLTQFLSYTDSRSRWVVIKHLELRWGAIGWQVVEQRAQFFFTSSSDEMFFLFGFSPSKSHQFVWHWNQHY